MSKTLSVADMTPVLEALYEALQNVPALNYAPYTLKNIRREIDKLSTPEPIRLSEHIHLGRFVACYDTVSKVKIIDKGTGVIAELGAVKFEEEIAAIFHQHARP